MKTLIALAITCCLISTNTYSQFLNAEQAARVAALPCEELDIETFIPIWLEKHRLSKIWGRELREFDADSIYTYFFLYTRKEKIKYKVKHTELQKLDYKSLDGIFIENCFYHNLLRPATEQENSVSTIKVKDYTLTFNPARNTILIKCDYKVTYRYRFFPVKATSTATYDINKQDIIR